MTRWQRLRSYAKRNCFTLRIAAAFPARRKIVIVEVGANDGMTGDPIFPLIQRGKCRQALLIEPVPYLFKRLQQTYQRNARCILENVAVGPTLGKMDFYFLNPKARAELPDLPAYFEELGSFDRASLAGMVGERHADLVNQVEVDTIPLRQLLERHGIAHVDILQVDTEGYDWEVLKTFPFETIQPKVVCFEHCHLVASDREEALSHLRQLGYRCERWGKDYFCLAGVKPGLV